MTYSNKHERRLSLLGLLAVAAIAGASLGVVGCDTPVVVPPHDAGLDTGFSLPDGTVRCTTDSECDDHVECTRDTCLSGVQVCSHTGNDAMCDDAIFCNGAERCDFTMGCVHETVHETCDDGDVCTIDRCDETANVCDHAPRDLDADGDPDFFCTGGTDCDDRDPTRNGHTPELCADMIDNDCDEQIDEADCGRPPHDTCADPIELTASGVTILSPAAATSDYTLSCVGFAQPDLVATFTLDAPHDVTITADSDFSLSPVALRTTCNDAGSEISCSYNFPSVIRRRALAAGTYFIVVQGNADVALDLEITDPTMPPTNETCASPIVVPADGGRFTGSFVDVGADVLTTCGGSANPDLVYEIDLAAESDVTVTLTSPMGRYLYWALESTCGSTATEVRCTSGSPADATMHQLAAGTYYLIVEGPSDTAVDFGLTVTIGPPTPRVPGDLCTDPIVLTPGTPYTGTLARAEDDYDTTCGFGYPDLVHQFTLTEASDVSIAVNGGSAYLNGSLRSTCDVELPEIRCDAGAPLGSHIRGMAPGTYYFVLEGPRGGAYTATVETTTPPTVPTPASGNDECGGATVIPEATGGLWSGTTVGMLDNYDPVLCGAGPSEPSPDVAFRLDLTRRSTVTVTTDGSTFNTLVYRMTGTCRSGLEARCDDDSGPGSTSQLSETLDPGTYFYVVDGWSTTAQGHYEFQAFVTPTTP